MDFGLSEDQQLLQRTVHDFLATEVPIERVRELRESDDPNDDGVWQALVELGVAGILIPEDQGGAGLGMLDAALVAEALGHAATPSRFLATAVIAPTLLREVGHDDATTRLPGIASGATRFGVGLTELFSTREGAGLTLEEDAITGKTLMALDAGGADQLLLALGPDSFTLVRGDAAGLRRERLLTVDTTRSTWELVLESVTPEAVFEAARSAIDRTLDAARIALAADTLGACQSMISQAVAYAKERRQFERPIGSFQAVKHMCAKMVAELEPARSLLWYAAHSFDLRQDDAPLVACHVLAHVSEISRDIASTATQVHGGIGWTDEQNLHFWFKRIANARHLLGGPERLRERAAALQGFSGMSA